MLDFWGVDGNCILDNMILDGGFQSVSFVSLYLGKIPILTNIFQIGLGWNHQLVPDDSSFVWMKKKVQHWLSAQMVARIWPFSI